MRLDQINLLDLDAFAGGFPHDWFTYLRHRHPVYRHPESDGPGFWVVTRHADVRAIGRDPMTYSSDLARGGVAPIDGPARPEAPSPFKPMLMMDPPEHTRYRKLVSRGFTPRTVGALEARVRECVDQILDAAIPEGTCDFVTDVAARLPQQVIAELLGIPSEDRPKIADWMSRLTGSDDPEFAAAPDSVTTAQTELVTYAHRLAAARRGQPRQGIVTELLAAEIDGDGLTDTEFGAFFVLLVAAGIETTKGAIAGGMNAFLQHPAEYDKLVQHPDALIGPATEEILRWTSPITYFRRNVTRDIELRGHRLAAGDKVSIWYPSANRDEEVFGDPFRFDIERTPNEHVAFGGGGPHFCLGAALARVEIRLLFEQLARRVPAPTAVADPDHLRSNLIGGIKHLVVAL
jgi:cholest-4-en-3-one 26-monooxygenase